MQKKVEVMCSFSLAKQVRLLGCAVCFLVWWFFFCYELVSYELVLIHGF